MKMSFQDTNGYQIIENYLVGKGQEPFQFQLKTWSKINKGYNGMVVAPTGFGKTYSVFLGVVIDFLNNPNQYKKGLKLIWISPLRSLAKDLAKAMKQAIDDIGLDWEVAVRNGDTPQKTRRQQERLMPDVLLTTPETMHLLFSQKNNSRWFKNIQCVAVDEWHELLGNKRGVLTELVISRLKFLSSNIKYGALPQLLGI